MSKEKEKFNGFIPPVSNYFSMPNEWVNICAGIKSLAELKVVQYVLRHTWGFQEYDGRPKPITTDEFMHGRKRRDGTRIDHGTGLSDRGVKDGISLAIEHGYLICEVDDSDKARIKKSYALKMLSESSDRKNLPTELDRKNSPIPDRKNLPTDRKNAPIDKEHSSDRSEKNTKERNLKKKTLEKKPSPLPLKRTSSKRSFSQPNQPRSSYDDPNYEDDSFYPTREVN
jgi:hypothetical protein